MSGAVDRWSAPSGSLSRVVDLVHGTAKWVITVDEEVVLAADYDTALAQRDRARDIAARLEEELARVRDVVVAARAGITTRPEREWVRIITGSDYGRVCYVVHRRERTAYLLCESFGLWFADAEFVPCDAPEWGPTDWEEGYVDACDEILQRIDEVPPDPEPLTAPDAEVAP